jgi:hypothetical protein
MVMLLLLMSHGADLHAGDALGPVRIDNTAHGGGDVSDAAPYWKDMASHCFVADQATVEGFYPPEWPHELRYFRVVHIEPCDHDNAQSGASQPDVTQAPSRP